MTALAIDKGSTVWTSQYEEPFLKKRIDLGEGSSIRLGTSAASNVDVDDSYSIGTFDEKHFDLFSAIVGSRFEEKVKRAMDSISEFMTYKKGWDGYEGDAFLPSTKDKADQILSNASLAFHSSNATPDSILAGPGSDGSMDIEFFLDQKHLIFSIDPVSDGTRCTRMKSENYIKTEEISFDWPSLVEQFIWLQNSEMV
jgi:hypothetical protein